MLSPKDSWAHMKTVILEPADSNSGKKDNYKHRGNQGAW